MKRTKTNEFHILAFDPSFTAWGWVVLRLDGKIVDSGCIKTAPEHKKRRIRKSDDTARRISEINNIILSVIKQYDIRYLLSEAPHGSQSAVAAVMVGAVTGMIQTIADALDIPIEWYSESDAKKALTNQKVVSKKETIRQIDLLYDVPWSKIGYKDEAVADALAIFNAAMKHSNYLRMLKKNAETSI